MALKIEKLFIQCPCIAADTGNIVTSMYRGGNDLHMMLCMCVCVAEMAEARRQGPDL